MEELSLGIIVIVLVVVWYLGKSINAILEGAGAVASEEFATFQDDQKARLAKIRKKQAATIKKYELDKAPTSKEIRAMLGEDVDA